MTKCFKNVLVVDGSGWFPYWADLFVEDGKVTRICYGENTGMNFYKECDEIVDYKKDPAGRFPEVYLIPGVNPPMTMEKYEAELKEIMDGLDKGIEIEKTVRKLTGFGYDMIEMIKVDVPADFAIVDKKPTTKILEAYAEGKLL